jgi:hypothetical protein
MTAARHVRLPPNRNKRLPLVAEQPESGTDNIPETLRNWRAEPGHKKPPAGVPAGGLRRLGAG